LAKYTDVMLQQTNFLTLNENDGVNSKHLPHFDSINTHNNNIPSDMQQWVTFFRLKESYHICQNKM